MSEEMTFVYSQPAREILAVRPASGDTHIVILDDGGNERVKIYRDRIELDERYTITENAELFVQRVREVFARYGK